MSTLLNEQRSKPEIHAHSVFGGITQQPGPFYNGNSSSTIWGNLPTPSVWQDFSYSSVPDHVDKEKKDSLNSLEAEQPTKQEFEKSGEDCRTHDKNRSKDALTSPFSFGFPTPSPPSSSSFVWDSSTSEEGAVVSNFTTGSFAVSSKENRYNVNQAISYSFQQPSPVCGSMLQSQGRPSCERNAQSPLFCSAAENSPVEVSRLSNGAIKSVEQHPDTGVDATRLCKQDALRHDTCNSGAVPAFVSCSPLPMPLGQKDSAGTFVFRSFSASANRENASCSQPNIVDASTEGCIPRSSSGAHSKAKKHNNLIRRRSSRAPGSSMLAPPMASKSSMDSSYFSNSSNTFAVGSSHAAKSSGSVFDQKVNKAYSRGGPTTWAYIPSASQGGVSSSSAANRASPQTSEAQVGIDNVERESVPHKSGESSTLTGSQAEACGHGQNVSEQFGSWHPFVQREESKKKNNEQARMAVHTTSKGKQHLVDKNQDDWQNNKQKENVEPDFVLGNQNVSKPFVFGSSTSVSLGTGCASSGQQLSRGMKESGVLNDISLGRDDGGKSASRLRGTKESTLLDHLVAKLGERMASLGKTYEGVEKFYKKDPSEYRFEKDVNTRKTGDTTGMVEKNFDVHCSIERLSERLEKLTKFDGESNTQNDESKNFSTRGPTDSVAVCTDKETNTAPACQGKCSCGECQQRGSVGNPIEHAVEELRQHITNLGKGDENYSRDIGSSPIDACGHLVQELCEKMVKLGNADQMESKSDANRESISTSGKAKEHGTFVFSASKSVEPMATSCEAKVGVDVIDSAPTVFSTASQASPSFAFVNPFSQGQSFFLNNEALNWFPGMNIPNGASSPTVTLRDGEQTSAVFQFHGSTKEEASGTRAGWKKDKGLPDTRRNERRHVFRSPKGSRVKMEDDVGSPMDFSPSAPPEMVVNEGRPQAGPDLDRAECLPVESLTSAASSLTIGEEHKSSNGERSGACANPFNLNQRKGKWKRVDRKVQGATFRVEKVAGPHERAGASHEPVPVAASFVSSVFEKGGNSAQNDTLYEKMPPGKDTSTMSNAKKGAMAEQICEKWRLRGNQAYIKGDYEKAEDCYSRGAGSVSPNETSQSCLRASMLCYSNRAATRMAVGRMREALADCRRAMLLDSGFLRVRLRAASCYLALGESSAAKDLFAECVMIAKARNSFDSKGVEEATEGVQKSQEVINLMERASTVLSRGGSSMELLAALRLLNEALVISPYSEPVLESKAHTLLLLRRYEDVVQLCKNSLPGAEKNHAIDEQSTCKDVNLWRWQVSWKALFYMGRLEECLSTLSKYKDAISTNPTLKFASTESVTTFVTVVRDMLKHKAAGNEAFQAGRHAEAVEHYTAALTCNAESRPYIAVCFCNRAAAWQALGQITDAIADCSRAIVLDPQYDKAISRRATLHEMVRDFEQACNDLRRLVGRLEGQESQPKSPKLTRGGPRTTQDLRQARDRLEKANRELKKAYVVDHYLILGLDVSCSFSDIKKSYRKAALKHHPDKAGQFLARGENADDGSLWKDVGEEIQRDAERLFKLIGESYAILSDPAKRASYDAEYHISRAGNKQNAGKEDYYSPGGERAGRRYRGGSQGHGGWGREYSPQYQRWQNGPDAAEPDSYSNRGSRGGSSGGNSGRKHRHRRSDFYWDEL